MRRRQPTHPPEQCQQTVTAGAWSNLGEDLFLYIDSCNVYLLRTGDHALVIDPTKGDMQALEGLLDETGLRPDVATATHYHVDHTDALNDVRSRWGAHVWLHPWVAEPIANRQRYDVPWLPAEAIEAGRLLPEEGVFRWQEFRFQIRPFPGQTWWHCAFDTHVDGRHVLFSGDNFQPPTRWNGTGGFCAYNGSCFTGFASSARTVIDLAPDLICNGHRCIYEYDADHYHRILKWCEDVEASVRDLCPTGDDWLADYDPRACRWEPFVQTARARDELAPTFVYTNHRSEAIRITITPVSRAGFQWSPAKRTLTIPAGASKRARFKLQVDAPRGRHILAVDVHEPTRLRAEAAVTIVDVLPRSRSEPPPSARSGAAGARSHSFPQRRTGCQGWSWRRPVGKAHYAGQILARSVPPETVGLASRTHTLSTESEPTAEKPAYVAAAPRPAPHPGTTPKQPPD